MALPETVCRAGALARITDRTAPHQGQLVLLAGAYRVVGQPGDNNRPPLAATITCAGVTAPSNPAGPNRCRTAAVAASTAATTSPQEQPTPSGIATSIPVRTATVRNHAQTASSRPAARRSHPRTVAAGTRSVAAICRCPRPWLRSDSECQIVCAA